MFAEKMHCVPVQLVGTETTAANVRVRRMHLDKIVQVMESAAKMVNASAKEDTRVDLVAKNHVMHDVQQTDMVSATWVNVCATVVGVVKTVVSRLVPTTVVDMVIVPLIWSVLVMMDGRVQTVRFMSVHINVAIMGIATMGPATV